MEKAKAKANAFEKLLSFFFSFFWKGPGRPWPQPNSGRIGRAGRADIKRLLAPFLLVRMGWQWRRKFPLVFLTFKIGVGLHAQAEGSGPRPKVKKGQTVWKILQVTLDHFIQSFRDRSPN